MKMTPFERALYYLDRFNWPVFPRPGGRYLKDSRGFKDATRDFDQIEKWWAQYPDALIAMPTGEASGIVVLDIDTKNGKDGFATLEDLGRNLLPDVPMVHTPHGGLHLYFALNQHVSIGTSQSKDGLGPGLDVLGEGGNVALPTPGWGYRWDAHKHPGTCGFLPAPSWFGRRRRRSLEHNGHRLDPTEILARACSNIRNAGPGSRHEVLNREAFIVGCIVARGALEEHTARHELDAATTAMTWGSAGDAKKAARDLADAFKSGLRKGHRR
jgi:hypothetical protein